DDLDYQYFGAADDEKAKVTFYLTLFHQLRTRRVNFETQWEEGASLFAPDYRGSFTYGREIPPGAKRTQYAIDSSGIIYAERFAAIADWLLTPQNMMWSKITVSDQKLRQVKAVKDWCSAVTHILWTERYKDTANFVGQNA